MTNVTDSPQVGDLTAELRSELGNLLDPLRARMTEIDARIATLDSEARGLRTARREAQKVIDLLDPPPAKAKAKPNYLNVAPDTLKAIETWLESRRDALNGDGGFSAPTMIRDHGYDGVSRATLTNALKLLHEQGRLRLDHIGHPGGAKYYKVVGDA